MSALVIGADGLLGRNVRRALEEAGHDVVAPAVRWWDEAAAREDLAEGLAVARARGAVSGDGGVGNGSSGQELAVAWCAGTGTPASPAESLAAEVAMFRWFLEALEALGSATLFFASSAGAVYAGVGAAPYREDSPVRPLAPYGDAKLAMEDLVRDWARRVGGRAVLGRLTNLYGPGQNPRKAQGLVSAALRTLLVGQPLRIYVPFETRRDYLYAADAGQLAAAALARAESLAPGESVVKILSFGQDVSITELLEQVEAGTGRTLQVEREVRAEAAVQALDLSVESTVWPDLVGTTSLADGVAATWRDLTSEAPEAAAAEGPQGH